MFNEEQKSLDLYFILLITQSSPNLDVFINPALLLLAMSQQVQVQPSAFLNVMDNSNANTNMMSFGENGAPEYTTEGVQESRVYLSFLFFDLVRDLPDHRLSELMDLVLNEANGDPTVIADLFLLVFQTRYCRGGKGEKDLFYKMILKLAVLYPQTVEALMPLVPHYGSFKDWFQIAALVENDTTNAMVSLRKTIVDLAAEQLLKDKVALDKKETSPTSSTTAAAATGGGISLLAKWAPREKKQFKKQVSALATKMFPHSKAPKKEYRQLLSRLGASMKCPETMMSSNRWDEIDFYRVPSICLMKNRKAFLNEKIKVPPASLEEEETGNRHPEDAVRVTTRKRLRECMLQNSAKKLKGKQLFPHEIVSKIMRPYPMRSTLENDLLSCQWDDIRGSVLTSIDRAKERETTKVEDGYASPAAGVDLGKVVSLVDVSGSMSGIPMEVAIALGILVGEVSSPAFANRCLTFSETPTWVQMDETMSLSEKVKLVQSAPWGMNTDFEKAMERIIEVAIESRLKPEEIPDLLVLSDMQFDQARDPFSYSRETSANEEWETHHQRIVRRFKEEGIRTCGEEWPAPHIIYWNLRGGTTGYPAQGDTPNVTMLSGFSPSLLKLLLDGEPLEADGCTVDENGDPVKVPNNPYSTLRKALDDADYNKVRKVLHESSEGALCLYKASEDAISDEVVVAAKGSNEDDWELVG